MVKHNYNNEQDDLLYKKLSLFFSAHHSSSKNTIISGDSIQLDDSQKILPENQDSREKIEKKIDELLAGMHISQNEIVPNEYFTEIVPLQHKIDAIKALGSEQILSSEIIDKAAAYLEKLDNDWRKEMGYDYSLKNRFHTAISGQGDTPYNRLNDEERLRKIKDEAMEKIFSNSL